MGDFVNEDEVLAEIETDKVSVIILLWDCTYNTVIIFHHDIPSCFDKDDGPQSNMNV